jgi:bis(5'-nucleosyl)-tetraphosphatase (symmetrical)
MAVYAIGDVQGCYDSLMKLLDQLRFDPAVDTIWLAGDLVNRGPKSAEVIRYAMSLGDRCISVLGNHDLHLLAKAAGVTDYHHHLDTLEDVLNAPDADEMVTWLRQQPLFHHDASLAFSMVHAGVPPQWTLEECLARAAEVETVISGSNWATFFEHMYGNEPKLWSETLKGWSRLRYITNCLTRLRYFYDDGRIALRFKGEPDKKPNGQTTWFDMPNRKTALDNIVFGHWSKLGIGQYGHVFSLDSGAVWGEKLTAVQIDSEPYQWVAVSACD